MREIAKEKSFLFSVITAIYNTEAYLAEAIESVIAQSIGFEEHIQMILINDGSTDSSLEICKEYQARYPDSIVVIDQKNQGVSAARNRGLELAQGEFINFLDSDDKWEKTAFAKAIKFSEKHPSIGIIATPIEFFDARKGEHTLNWKFDKGNKVVDILKDHEYTILHAATTFIKRSVIKTHRFNSKISISEDACFINEILLEQGCYGLMASTNYLYRRRHLSASAINTSLESRSFYFESVELYLNHLSEYSKKIYGSIVQYVQVLLLYELYYRIRARAASILSDQEVIGYQENLLQLLRCIDDEIILNHYKLTVEYKLYFLGLKNGELLNNVKRKMRFERNAISYNGIKIRDIGAESRIRIETTEIEESSLHLRGLLYTIGEISTLLFEFRSGNEKYPANIEVREKQDTISLFGDYVKEEKSFSVTIPLKKSNKIVATITEQNAIIDGKYDFSTQIGLSRRYKPIYLKFDKWHLFGLQRGKKLILKRL